MLTRSAVRLAPALPRLGAPAAIAMVWSLVAIVAAVQAAALVWLEGRADVVGAITSRVSIIPVWALATPVILRSARWLPVARTGQRPNPLALLAHGAFGSLFVVLANVLIRAPILWAPSGGRGFDALVQSTLQGVAEYYPPAMVVYGVIVAAGHLLWREAPALATNIPAPIAPSPEQATAPISESRLPFDEMSSASAEAMMGAAPSRVDGHLTVRQWNRVHLVRIEEIEWVEAQDNYVVVHAASRSYKGRERISDVEVQLDPQRFVRIHRSTIVQVGKIREVQPLTHGDHAVILRDGTVLRVARSRRQALGEALGLDL
ncbi:MAG: Two component transcriptional regulator, LytTR family [Geminicoccaceae bacterium]|nr:Two component transcriptional regulator, LytTR family [Geminicoccaceae bacterium]